MAVDLNYEKDSKERIPYEHYLEVYQNADPKEISSRCDVPYDAEKQEFTVSLMGVSYRISWPEEASGLYEEIMEYAGKIPCCEEGEPV